jgi:hypothetical protein
VTTTPGFDLVREWASTLRAAVLSSGEVVVGEPAFPSGGLTVDIDLDRTVGQVILWPTGMLELRVMAVESGDEVATESHQVRDAAELAAVLRRVEELVARTQARS